MPTHYPPTDWRPAFLASLRECPVIQRACDLAMVERSTVFRRRQTDKEFAEAYDEAMEAGVDRAEQEAFRRGVEGFTKPVVHQGRVVYLTRREVDAEGNEHYVVQLDDQGQPVPLLERTYSDALLGRVLAARRSSYRTSATEVSGPGGAPMQVADASTREARVAAILEAARARREAAAIDPESLA